MAVLAMLATLLSPQSAAADNTADFPLRPIRLVIGAPPCGETDTLARLVAEYIGEDLGQPVIVDYKPGAATNFAAEAVARSEPDGYTILLGGRANITHRTMYPWIKYDYARDLMPLGLVGTVPPILVAGMHTPINGMQDLVRMAQERPGELTCGSVGSGSSSHLICEILMELLGVELRHVPYRGSAAALTNMIGGRIDVQITAPAAALPYIRAGKLRPLVILGPVRLPTLPEVPALPEVGIPGDDYRLWFGLLAPTGTPAQVVERLNQSINTALQNPKMVETMVQIGVDPATGPNSPAEFKKLIVSEITLWTGVVRKHSVRPVDLAGEWGEDGESGADGGN